MIEKTEVKLTKNIYPAEHAQRVKGLKSWVENIVLKTLPEEPSDYSDEFQNFSIREKTDQLYKKLMAYYVDKKIIAQEKKENPQVQTENIDADLISQINVLWKDPETQDMFLDRFADARIEERLYRESETGKHWKDINSAISTTQAVYEQEVRRLFLKQVIRPSQVEATEGRAERFAKELIRLQSEKQRIINLQRLNNGKVEDLPRSFENTDVLAHIMYETLCKYNDQLISGFVWLPSRLDIHVQTIEALKNARWPVLTGESGTGKSQQANAAAFALTGEQPTSKGCNQNTGERDLIFDKVIAAEGEGGGSYEEYGPVMQAATGFNDSREEKPSYARGRIVRLDESGRLGDRGYALIKELRQKRPATPDDLKKFKEGRTIDPDKLLHGKPVLPGFAGELTTNPPGPRYLDRTQPDAALRRELAPIKVDYPSQTIDNPEIYEFMLSALMDKNHHIPVAKEELAPYYYLDKRGGTLPDKRRITAEQKLTEDPTDSNHGSLYRLSFAIRALQDAFNYGNHSEEDDPIPTNALRYEIDENKKIKIVKTGGEVLTLNNSTVTLGEIGNWMKGFLQRRHQDDLKYQTDTLTEWIQLKLRTYLQQTDAVDRDKIEAIFNHFNLFNNVPDLTRARPITPKEIGYLSPRVPRPFHLAAPVRDGEKPPVSLPDQKPHEDILCMLEDTNTVLARLEPLSFTKNGKDIHLKNGSRFVLSGKRLQFAGFAPDGQVVVRIDTGKPDEALHRLISLQQLQEQAEFPKIDIEYARSLFKEKFFGAEEVQKAFDVNLFPDQIPDIAEFFTQEEIERFLKLGMRLELRINKAKDGAPLTLQKMESQLQKIFDRKHKGKILYHDNWDYTKEPFFTSEVPRAKWAVVGDMVIPGSTGNNYLEQTEILADYLQSVVFNGQMPTTNSVYKEAIDEFNQEKADIANLVVHDWKKAAECLAQLKLNQMFRHNVSEVIYDSILMLRNKDIRFLSGIWTWTNTRASDDYLVFVGRFGSGGAYVGRWVPDDSHSGLGVVLSR